MNSFMASIAFILCLVPCLVSSWRIEKGGVVSTSLLTSSILQSSSSWQQDSTTQSRIEGISTPPNIADPDYFHPTATGGRAQHVGNDGMVVFIAKMGGSTNANNNNHNNYKSNPTTQLETTITPPTQELRAHYSLKENEIQEYRVPGNARSSPYEQEVRVKVWGGGGGGCDGGRGEIKEPNSERDNDNINNKYFSEGAAGSYTEATFFLPIGTSLQITIGGGGHSQQSLPSSLGGKGGTNGGHFGQHDQMSGGGGGGGYSVVKLGNGTVIVAAYGGNGGGGSGYCTAVGGAGGRLVRGVHYPLTKDDGYEEEDIVGGYINFDLAYFVNDLQEKETIVCPGVPDVSMLSHDAAKFSWNAGSYQYERSKELYVHRYTVHQSEVGENKDYLAVNSGNTEEGNAICSSHGGDYKLQEHIKRTYHDINKNATTTLTNLQASTPYCIRIEAFSMEGLSLGVQFLLFQTKLMPVNEWLAVSVRQWQQLGGGVSTVYEKRVVEQPLDDDESNNNNNKQLAPPSTSSSWCEHSTSQPTGRRGHSMTIINDQVYIFGGATLKCICEFDTTDTTTAVEEEQKKKQCSSKNVYSNELWHFEPRTAMFTQLEMEQEFKLSEEDNGEEESSLMAWPRGREQHSATALPNGIIVIVGGISTSNNHLEIIGEDIDSSELLLSDVWAMRDPHHIVSSKVFSSGDLDEEEIMPIELIPGYITSHQMSVSLDRDNALLVGEDMMCVNDVRVRISLEHSCLKAIEYIKLAAPGTKDVADHDAPQSRDYETKIFVSSMESREHECQASSIDLLFSDDAKEYVLSHASIPISGTFHPASSLRDNFVGLPINGEWKLSIATSLLGEQQHHGRVLDWELTMDAKPCNARPKWEKLPDAPIAFSPRRLHTAITVENSIFIAGGFAKRRLNDLWRFDYDSYTWTELNSAAMRGQWPLNGQVSVLGQFGLLAYGGIAAGGPHQQGHDLWLLDLFEGDGWVNVPIPQNTTGHSDGQFNNNIPYGRYLSSIGLLNDVDSIYKSYNIDGKGPMALVFGGDGGLLHNTYADSYGFMPNSFFDDVWLLSPAEIGSGSSSTNQQQRREDHCDWRWMTGSTAYQIWNNTCGWSLLGNDDSPGECQLNSIFIAAWCREQYQSFYMS